jgi:nuclear transport factor 2 (NTF2) superfamily protein
MLYVLANWTTLKIADTWAMKGPHALLVGLASATHSRPWENQAHHIQAINRDHSQLVKFKANDEVYDRVLNTLQEFVGNALAMKRGQETKAEERKLYRK